MIKESDGDSFEEMRSIKQSLSFDSLKNIFKDRREFSASLMQQLHDVYNYIDFYNQVHASFHMLLRIDNRDYSEVAVREALLNSLVHRDYSIHADTLISIYSNHMEFVTLGGLLPGLELDDIKMGISVCRNPQLANVFYRLQLIEAYGTGIKKSWTATLENGNSPPSSVAIMPLKSSFPIPMQGKS